MPLYLLGWVGGVLGDALVALRRAGSASVLALSIAEESPERSEDLERKA